MTTERAGWWTRVGAQVIDGLIIAAFALVVMIVVAAAGGNDSARQIGLYGAVLVGTVVYGTVMLSRTGDANGQTIGKRAMGIRVVRIDGQPITVGVAARREVFGKGVLGLIPFFGLVDVLWPLGDEQNQAIHDKVADTYVVPQDAPAAAGAPAVAVYAPPTPDVPAPSPPPAPPPVAPDSAPDLGGFAPPVAPQPDRPADDEDVPGPFGPSYDD